MDSWDASTAVIQSKHRVLTISFSFVAVTTQLLWILSVSSCITDDLSTASTPHPHSLPRTILVSPHPAPIHVYKFVVCSINIQPHKTCRTFHDTYIQNPREMQGGINSVIVGCLDQFLKCLQGWVFQQKPAKDN